jgi:RND family efflux transporter MFP subunit
VYKRQEIDRVAQQKTVRGIFAIRAPKGGVITARDIDPGETIDANQHLFVITDLSRVWLIGQIFEKDLRRLTIGMPVTCTVSSYPDQEFKGHLEYLGAKLDPQTRTLPVRAAVKNDGHKLRLDMFGHILITVGHESVLTVPKEALQTIGETQVVFVRRGERFERRAVTPANEIDNFVEIIKGLNAGDQIVTTGSIDLLGKTLQSLKQ